MKLKNKAIIALLIVMFSVMIQQTVNAVGNVYQAIVSLNNNNNNGEKQLIYRTIAKPFKGTLDEFSAYNKWVYNKDTKNVKVEWGNYKTEDLIFTKNMIGSYEKGATYKDGNKIGVGYVKFYENEEMSNLYLGNSEKMVKKWVQSNISGGEEYSLNNVEHVQNVKVTDGFGSYFYEYSYNSESNPKVTNQNLSQKAFDAYNANTIDGLGTKVYGSLFSSKVSGDIVIPATNTIAVNGIAEYKTLREMLYHTDESKTGKRPNKDDDETKYILYITDVILDAQTTKALQEYKNKTGGDIYVSTIPYTMNSNPNGKKFYMLTPRCMVAF